MRYIPKTRKLTKCKTSKNDKETSDKFKHYTTNRMLTVKTSDCKNELKKGEPFKVKTKCNDLLLL